MLASEFRLFLDRARSPEYRPATIAEARRLLRSQLRGVALELEAERRGRSTDTPSLEETYRSLTLELTGSPPLGLPSHDQPSSDSTGVPTGATRPGESESFARLDLERRARVQRAAILEWLLDRVEIEIDADQLAAFVDPPPSSDLPPRPPRLDPDPGGRTS